MSPIPTQPYTDNPEIARIAAERKANFVEQSTIESQMHSLSARLRDLREAERDLTIRLINAHFTSATLHTCTT